MFVFILIEVGLCVVSFGMTMEINAPETFSNHKSDLWRSDKYAVYAETSAKLLDLLRNDSSVHVPVLDGNPNNGTTDVPIEGIPEQCVNGTYSAVSTNCSAFLVCNEGNRTAGNCPPHLWFDPNHVGDLLCNDPEKVCAADNSVCDCARLYPTVPSDPLIEADMTCPDDNQFYFNRSRVECGRHFVCFNGHIRRLECKQGFHYNPKTERCDYPELVNCQIIDPDCPTHGVGFLPHADRRDAFYFCFHGYKTLQLCAFYHVWDEATNSCRRRDEMNMF